MSVEPDLPRRDFLRLAAVAGAAAILRPRFSALAAPPDMPLVRFPEKGDLLLLTDRPPQLEMPVQYFAQDLTPNDLFFVRWHLAAIPTKVDAQSFRLKIHGHVDKELSLSLDDLRRDFSPVELVAACQCSGNSRSLFEPRVPGGQWGNGALGNARWTGVRLRDVLARAGLKTGAVDVSFRGLDRPPLSTTPVFEKSLAVDKANDPDILIAYAMNGADLPLLNGYPLRLVVPGWYATYWVKSLADIQVWPTAFKSFWMDTAYRIPNNALGQESPAQLAAKTVPISTMALRSLFATPADGAKLPAGKDVAIEGIALDGGSGIKRVEVSTDDGQTWADATLGKDLGKFSWRRWSFTWRPAAAGNHRLLCRATSNSGESQGKELWNRSGYRRNVIEHLDVTVA